MEQEITNEDTRNKNFDSDVEENSNVRAYLTSLNATKWSCMPKKSNMKTRLENVIRLLMEEKSVDSVPALWFSVGNYNHQNAVNHTNKIQVKQSICTNSNAQMYHKTSVSQSERLHRSVVHSMSF